MMLWTLVRRARRRAIGNAVLAEAVYAGCVALGAWILLLVAGAAIVHAGWAAVVTMFAVATAAYRAWRQVPDSYRAARRVDRALGLADTLSTAVFFASSSTAGRVADDARRCQFEQAERAAAGVDVRRAVPMVIPRAAYGLAGMLVVASSLCALRYGVAHRLDLRPPLARMLWPGGTGDAAGTGESAKRRTAPNARQDAGAKGLSLADPSNDTTTRPEPATDAEKTPETASAASAPPAPQPSSQRDAEPGDPIAGEGDENHADSFQTADGDPTSRGEQGGGQENSSKQEPEANQRPNGTGNSGNSSLLQKFQDAMQNLLSKVKPSPAGHQASASGAPSARNVPPGKGQAAGQQKDSQGQKSNQNAKNSSALSGQNGQDAPDGQDAPAKSAGARGDDPAHPQPGSGIGRRDGNKDVQLAEQMAAMGKISEIIGKRSANLTGEAMVEVKETRQQLSTRYETRRAVHADAGAEIRRDEVPIELRGYVREYFELTRKAAEGAPAATKQARP